MATCREMALALSARGKSVFPVGKDKRPLFSWQAYQENAPDQSTLAEWFDKWPEANLAMPTGKLNGLMVIDCDSEEANGKFLAEFPEAKETTVVKTPRGYHYYFQYEEGVRNDAGHKLGKDIDVRGDGGYVLVPPSSTPDGLLYKFISSVSPGRISGGLLPRLLDRQLADDSRRGRPTDRGDTGVLFGTGSRNSQLTRVAGALRRQGVEYDALLESIRATNEQQCSPPLPESELITIARSVCRYPTENAPEQRRKTHDLITVKMSDVQRENVRWLWHKRIPIGRITMIEGDGGVAKSWLTMAIASIVTRGDLWPQSDGFRATAGNVLIMSAEDSINETIVARLEDQGADTERAVAIEGLRDQHGERPISLKDIDRLSLLIEEWQPTLAIIDPVVAYLGDKDMNHAGSVRSLLAPLSAVANRSGTAVILVRHLNKSSEMSAKYRGQGSVDFYSACRSAFQVIPDSVDRNKRHMVHIKSNLGPIMPTLEFSIVNERRIEFGGINFDSADVLHRRVLDADKKTKDANQGEDSSGITRTF